MSRFKAVVFDFGFTLFEFRDCTLERFREVFKLGLRSVVADLTRLGLLGREAGRATEFMRRFFENRRAAWRRGVATCQETTTAQLLRASIEETFGVTPDDRELQRLADAFHEVEGTCWVPFHDAKSALEVLRSRGYALAVLSNHPHPPFVPGCLKKHGLDAYFDVVLSSAHVGWRKPSRKPFQEVMDALGVGSPGLCAMVGDEPRSDVFGGNRAGMRTILKTRAVEFPFEMESPVEPDAMIDELGELPEELERL
ncbi:MAG: hypothetical protein Kow0069_09520 [Promethearchaeota archaeon]